ncbi:MAG: IclR family transcriptional regulator [Pseudonocardia sp. SCN 72-86]|nr:MAG: IclR family transcriptional regulator [Pseudonocardia sp. SCN 72-86]
MAEESSVRVLERACGVLDCFTTRRPRLQIADIRRLTGLPATTVARLVKTLVAQELLERDGNDYRLGLRVMVWGAPAAAASDLLAVGGPVAEQIRDTTQETTGIYVRRGATRVNVYVVLSTLSVIYNGYVGQVMPLHAGAAGKVFMAYDGAARDAALRAGLTPFTEHTPTDQATIDTQTTAARSAGWVFAAEERESGLNSLAAPIFDANGTIAAAIAIGGPSSRLSAGAASSFGPMLAAAGLAISRRLGFTADQDGPTSAGTVLVDREA